MIDIRTSVKIRVLSVLSLFVVVLQHSSVAVGNGIYNRLWRNGLSHGIADYPVSFFFMLSGFFLAQHNEAGWYKAAILKRVKSLVVPYSIWCVIGWMLFDKCNPKLILDSFGITRHSPVLSSLWYVKILYLLVLVSPLLFLLEKKICISNTQKVTFFLFLYFIVSTLCLFVNIPAQKTIVFSTLYFMLGMLIARTSIRGLPKQYNLIVSIFVVVMLIVLKIVCVFRFNVEETFLRWFVVPSCIIMLWKIYDLADTKMHLADYLNNGVLIGRTLLSGTFFLYCAQDLIMKLFRKGFLGLKVSGLGFPNDFWGAFSFALIVSICAVALLLFLSKVCPRLYLVLNGGRQ